MRPILLTTIGLSLLIGAAGCNLIRARPEPPDAKAPPVPTVDHGRPTPEKLTRYLNNQAALLHSIEARDLSIDVRAPGVSVGLDGGSLLCQKSRYFRLIGKKFGSQEVLVGSNEDRFWFYVKRDPSDALFHCSYNDFDKGSVELPFPFEPEWVLEALGMSETASGGTMRVEEDGNTYQLVEDTTLRGRKIRKVTVFYKGTARGDEPQVKSRTMYDDRNKIICAATIKTVTRKQVDQGPNGKSAVVVVPQVIKLEWPAQETELILDLGQIRINERLALESFQMPRLGSKQIDLARDRGTSYRNEGVVPARGVRRR